MDREVDILRYLPPILHEIKELQKIAELENPTLEQVWQMVEDALNNQFVVTANENGLSRYERIFKLVAGESEDIETRRFRVMSRYQERLPFSWLVLENSLDTLLGKGNYELTRSTSEKWIRVRLELTVQRQFEVVEMMLERVTPQNVILYVEIRYNQHYKLEQFTHMQLAEKEYEEFIDFGNFGEPIDSNFDCGEFGESFDVTIDCHTFIGRTHEELRSEVLI